MSGEDGKQVVQQHQRVLYQPEARNVDDPNLSKAGLV